MPLKGNEVVYEQAVTPGGTLAGGSAGPAYGTPIGQIGAGAAYAPPGGNLNGGVQVSSAGINPGATAADNVLAVFSIPANTFDAANRTLTIIAAGKFAANGNTKQIKIIFNPATAVVGSTVGTGGTTIADTGAVTTSGGGWQLQASVVKYGAAASNTQLGIHNQAQVGAAVSALLAPSAITATENAAILVAVTGNATTTATDIVFQWLEIFGSN